MALSPLVLFGLIAYNASTYNLDQVARDNLNSTAGSVQRALTLLEQDLERAALDNSTWDDFHTAIAGEVPDKTFLDTYFGADVAASVYEVHHLDALNIWERTGTKTLYAVGEADQILGALPHLAEQAAKTDKPITLLQRTQKGVYIVTATTVVTTQKEDPNGVILFARRLSDDDMTQIKAVTGHDVALYVGAQPLASTQHTDRLPNVSDLNAAAHGQQVLDLNNPSTALVYQPLTDNGGQVIGTMVIWGSLDAISAAQNSIAGILLPAFALTALVSVLVAATLRAQIARPLVALANAADKIAAGDLSQQVSRFSTNDELGRVANAFNQMAARLQERVGISEAENERLHAIDEYRLNLFTGLTNAFRAPINQIQNHSQTLRIESYGPLNEAQYRSADAIHRAVNIEQALLSNLLDFARAHKNLLRFERNRFPLEPLIATVKNRVVPHFEGKHVIYDQQIPAGLPQIFADPLRLEQVLEKLLEWTFNYSEKGDSVLLSASPLEDEVRLDITQKSQNGQLLSADDQQRIFDLFYVEETASMLPNTRSGDGLGLALVKILVEQQGGTLCLEVSTEKGNQFQLTIPAVTIMPTTAR